MIIEKPIGRSEDPQYQELEKDYLFIEWYNTSKKIDRKMTAGGQEVGIRLDHATGHRGLRQDDVVYADQHKAVIVQILTCKCLTVKVSDPALLVKFCYEIGNRHAPFFYGEEADEFLIPYDKPIQEMIEKLGIAVTEKAAVLDPEHRISGTNGHTH